MAMAWRHSQDGLQSDTRNDDIIQMGNLEKQKNNKPRYFVLRTTSKAARPRFECYHSEKKFKDGTKPSRTIFLSDVLNVAKTKDPEYHFSFAIFLKDEKFGLMAKFPDERDTWIDAFNFVKKQSQTDQLISEFIWDVQIRDEGLAKGTLLHGECRLKKRGNSFHIMKKSLDEIKESFLLANVKTSGFSDSLVFLEIGRSHSLGPGELWIEAEDQRTAEDIYTVFFGSDLKRPKSCVSTDRSKFMSDMMTNNRRKSDGADKAKLRKKGILFPFLRSKIKDNQDDVNPKLKSKRSHSASEIQKLGVNQEGDYVKLKLLQQRSVPLSNSVNDVRRDTIASKKSRKKSLFRNSKREISSSAQEIHRVDVETRSTLPRDNRVSVLKMQYERSISKSAQNIENFGRRSPNSMENGQSSRVTNIKNLRMMHANSTSNLLDSCSGNHQNDTPPDRNGPEKARPFTMAFDNVDDFHKSIFRKTKWRSFENESKENSPAVSSCSSIDSLSSYHSVDSTGAGIRATSQDISDEGYVRMNYNCGEEKPYANVSASERNSLYMLIKPDSEISKNAINDQQDQETYMDMSSARSLDFEAGAAIDENETELDINNESNYCEVPSSNDGSPYLKSRRNVYEEAGPCDSKQNDNRPVPLPPKPSRCSMSSTDDSVFASGSWEDASLTKLSDSLDNPIPLPPRTRRELSSQYTSTTDYSSMNYESPPSHENPVPLPPKLYRQVSMQSYVSEDEKAQRLSANVDNRFLSSNTSSDSESPTLLPRYAEQNSSYDVDKPIRSTVMTGRPLPSLPRGVDPKNIEENVPLDRVKSGRGATISGPEISPENNSNETPLYAIVDKKQRTLSVQNTEPLPPMYDRQSTQVSVKSEDMSSPTKSIRQFAPLGKENASPRAYEYSEISSPVEGSAFSPTTPEKKNKGRFRDIGKRMTVNFRQNKKSTSSPKKRMSEATSHFYVETSPVIDTGKSPEAQTETIIGGREPRPLEAQRTADDCSSNITKEQEPAPIRPTYLELNKEGQKKLEVKENIYTTVDEKCINNDKNVSDCIRSAGTPVYQSKTSQIQQDQTRPNQSYEVLYTEVTLRERTNPNMPLKGIKTLTGDKKKQKVKAGNDLSERVEERADERMGLDIEEVEQCNEPHRRISQKILSSPTKDGKGYENISLLDDLITTPLDEVEGRPYMNLGFHKNKGKSNADKRRSADDAAMKLLMNLQNDRKISDELSVRRKSNADIQRRNESQEIQLQESEEASYVNIGRDRQLIDSSGRNITQGIGAVRNRRASEPDTRDDSAYQNINPLSHTRRDENAERKGFDIKSRARLDTPSDETNENVYSNVIRDSAKNSNEKISPKQERNVERPIAKPRPKKPERRNINQLPASVRKISTPCGGSPAAYDEVNLSPKHGFNTNGTPNANFGISESSYVNVGSYQDDFDIGRLIEGSKPVSKSQSYENLIEEFQPRRNRKKSEDYDLAYTDVQLLRERRDEIVTAGGLVNERSSHFAPTGSDDSSPNSSKKNNGKKNISRSRCAYTEIDFMKSQGICEAVRERRVESFEGETERD